MSVTRYYINYTHCIDGEYSDEAGLYKLKDGDLVKYEDYEKLLEEYMRVTNILNTIEGVTIRSNEKTIEFLLNE